MDMAATAQRVGGGRVEGQSRLEVNQAGGGERSGVGDLGTYHSLRRKEVAKVRKVQGGQSAKIRRECKRAEENKESCPDPESDVHQTRLKDFSGDTPGRQPSKQAISYEEVAHSVGFVGTGRPSSELSFCETANCVELVGAADDSDR